ncbi:hypothetical protein Tco_1016420 [Tanacetum coccineum]|uniref:Uncharacterized protein n=1 Tax=Tanacetum coccineum TaxID=301880 RepID=A0ABQ5FNK5_9ASTR
MCSACALPVLLVKARNTPIKDDAKKTELPPTSSNLSVSSGFGDQFLKLSSDTSLISTVKDTTYAEINSLLDIKIQYEVLHIQSPYVLRVPVFVISEPSVLSPVQETPSVAPKRMYLSYSAKALATLKSQVPTIVEYYLGSKIGNDLQKVLQRHTTELIQKYSVKPAPESSKIQEPTIDLEQESEKSA